MFETPIQIRMSDLDPYNHVNNGSQNNLFDYGRTKYFENALNTKIDWLEFDLVLVHLEFDFRQSIRYYDNIFCKTKVVSFGEKSIKMEQTLFDKDTMEIKTECRCVIAGFDRKKNTSKPIPELYKKKIDEFEKKS